MLGPRERGAGVGDVCQRTPPRSNSAAASLPDCRAYEQVTPPYKEGFELLPVSYSRDGETAVLETYGAIAGTEGDSEEGATAYVVRRTSAGWRTEPLEPPGAAYPGQAIRAANADSGASLWQLHSRHQSPLEVGLYTRSAAGSWTAIGPLVLPGGGGRGTQQHHVTGLNASIAATADYSHVVFSTPKSELDGAGHAYGGRSTRPWGRARRYTNTPASKATSRRCRCPRR